MSVFSWLVTYLILSIKGAVVDESNGKVLVVQDKNKVLYCFSVFYQRGTELPDWPRFFLAFSDEMQRPWLKPNELSWVCGLMWVSLVCMFTCGNHLYILSAKTVHS